MPSVFTMIIDGDLPARFVWRDEHCVAFLSINPLSRGHTLVVPREEVDHWIDLDEALLAHCVGVARMVGRAIDRAFAPARVGVIVAGFEVPHVHIHVVATDSMADLDFANIDPNPDPADLDGAAAAIRAALAAMGHGAE